MLSCLLLVQIPRQHSLATEERRYEAGRKHLAAAVPYDLMYEFINEQKVGLN